MREWAGEMVFVIGIQCAQGSGNRAAQSKQWRWLHYRVYTLYLFFLPTRNDLRQRLVHSWWRASRKSVRCTKALTTCVNTWRTLFTIINPPNRHNVKKIGKGLKHFGKSLCANVIFTFFYCTNETNKQTNMLPTRKGPEFSCSRNQKATLLNTVV